MRKRPRDNAVYLVFSRDEPVGDDFDAYPNRMETFFTCEEAKAHVQSRLPEFREHVMRIHDCQSEFGYFPCPVNATEEEMKLLEDMSEDEREDTRMCDGPYHMARDVAIKACMQLPKDIDIVETWGTLEDPYSYWIQVIKVEQKEK